MIPLPIAAPESLSGLMFAAHARAKSIARRPLFDFSVTVYECAECDGPRIVYCVGYGPGYATLEEALFQLRLRVDEERKEAIRKRLDRRQYACGSSR